MELAFAGLHQLSAPLLDGLERVPGPQREALLTAFGVSAGPSPDRFLIGLAVLSLLSAAAEERPLIGVVDDTQWLDRRRRRRWDLPRAGWLLILWGWCSRRGFRATMSQGCRDWRLTGYGSQMRGRCWTRC